MTNTTDLGPITALAATRNTTVPQMVIEFDSADTELAAIIRSTFGVDHITDSVIDDITDELTADDHEYCNHAEGHCEMGDMDDDDDVAPNAGSAS